MVCYPDKSPGNLSCFGPLDNCQPSNDDPNGDDTTSLIPHIVGYFEVSSIMKYPRASLKLSNINLNKLKSATASSITNLMRITGTETIPSTWLSFHKTIVQMLSNDQTLEQQPLMSLSHIHELAFESGIVNREKVVAMLRFFHSQGTFLWYEDLPEMKDVVIIDPQWLSDQLRTLISHRSSVNFICDGVLPLADLSTVWADISEENRRKLLCLFRSVGLCFRISDTEELFPCNLAVGWPDREMWPPLPSPIREPNQSFICIQLCSSIILS